MGADSFEALGIQAKPGKLLTTLELLGLPRKSGQSTEKEEKAPRVATRAFTCFTARATVEGQA